MSVPTNQPLTWIELLETIFFSWSKMTICLINFQPKNCQSRCHLLWQLWAILRFIGHFLCCPETVTKSNLNIQILLKSSPWMGRVRSVVELYWCTNRDSWTTRDGPVSVQSRSRLQTIFWHFGPTLSVEISRNGRADLHGVNQANHQPPTPSASFQGVTKFLGLEWLVFIQSHWGEWSNLMAGWGYCETLQTCPGPGLDNYKYSFCFLIARSAYRLFDFL